MNNNHTYNVSIAEIIASLEVRGFLAWSTRRINLDVQQVQLQLDAVMEELGRLAGVLRRQGQGHAPINHDELAVEAADIVIAAVCLFANAAGMDTDEILIAKLRSDEARGWLHSGLTREQYERTHGDRN
jgi:predicted nucleic acid-binding protein